MGVRDDEVSSGLVTPKPGYLTTEFWIVIITALLPALTLLFHKDFSSSVQAWATAAAGLATVIYVLSRAFVKSAYVRAQRPTPDAAGGTPAVPAVAPDGSAVRNPAIIVPPYTVRAAGTPPTVAAVKTAEASAGEAARTEALAQIAQVAGELSRLSELLQTLTFPASPRR